MNDKRVQWGILALVMFITMLSLVLPPLSKPKLQPRRLQTANRLASVSMTLPSTNLLRDIGDTQQSSGKAAYDPYFTKQNPIPDKVK